VEEKFTLPAQEALHIRPEMLANGEEAAPLKPERWVLTHIAERDGEIAHDAGRLGGRENVPDTAHSAREQNTASSLGRQLVNSENDIVRKPDNSERGRMPEHDEQMLNRTIQKER